MLAACASTAQPGVGQSPGASVAATVASSAGVATGAPSTTSAPSTNSASPAGSKVAAVDLVFSGTFQFTAKGSAGECRLGTRLSDGQSVFGFGATGADYAGLGEGFYIDEDAATGKILFKWLIQQGTAYFGYINVGATVSADHHAITLDADLAEGNQDPQHVAGTIVCP